MSRILSRWILKLWGWKVVGTSPGVVKKCVVPTAPHTSNLDFILGTLSRIAIGVSIGFVGKHTLFRPPLGWLFYWLGGMPVNRTRKGQNYVDSVADVFKQTDEFRLCVAIEGTRSKVERLRTGFYYIALKANIPMVLCRIDGPNKILYFDKPFYPTGNIEADFGYVYDFFDGVRGINPENSFIADELAPKKHTFELTTPLI